MTNLTSMLRNEIARISRKEMRAATEKLKKSFAQYRSEIAALKRHATSMERQVASLEKIVSALTGSARPPEPARKPRFTAKGFKSLRARLGLSAEEAGLLLDVTGQTIYSWEAERSSPRPAQMERIIALRGLNKRSVADILNGYNKTT